MNLRSNQKLVFIHVPKAAGSTCINLIKTNYGKKNVFTFPRKPAWASKPIIRYLYDEWVTKKIVNKKKIIAGHKQFQFYKNIKSQILFLAVVRDPVKRIISSYNYILSGGVAETRQQLRSGVNAQKKHRIYYEKWLSVGFDPDSLKNTLKSCRQFRKRSQNFQCQYIAGVKRFDDVLGVFEKNDFIVGTQENFSGFLNYIHENFGWDISNVPARHAVKGNYQEKYYNDTDLIEELESLNQEDRKLYSFILDNGLFNNALYDYSVDFHLDHFKK
ncbi:MAG: sulfotransferase family protein [Desulfobacterales bacterium]|nr:sulfotransferase family protein [Desulfobacterales bacterium]